MENKLKNLFDYQRFEKNPKLTRMIMETELCHGKELSDEEAEQVSAAGVENQFFSQEKNKPCNQTVFPGNNDSDN